MAEVLIREVVFTHYYEPKGVDAFLHLQPHLQNFKSETLSKVLPPSCAFKITSFFARGQRAFKLVLKSIKEEEGEGRGEMERNRKRKKERKNVKRKT